MHKQTKQVAPGVYEILINDEVIGRAVKYANGDAVKWMTTTLDANGESIAHEITEQLQQGVRWAIGRVVNRLLPMNCGEWISRAPKQSDKRDEISDRE